MRLLIDFAVQKKVYLKCIFVYVHSNDNNGFMKNGIFMKMV